MPAPLWVHVLRDGRLVDCVALESLPFGIGSKAGSDLVLDDDAIASTHARVTLGPDGTPEYRTKSGPERLPVAAGTHLTAGPFVLAFGPAPTASPGTQASLPLQKVLALLPRLWDEDNGQADLGALLETLLEVFDARWGALLRGDPKAPDAAPEVLFQAGTRPTADGPLSRTVLRQLQDADGPILVDGAPALGDAGPTATIPLEVRSVLAAPLLLEGHREGLIYLETPRSRKTFRAEERETLVALCDLAAGELASRQESHALRAREARMGELYREGLAARRTTHGLVGASPAMRAVTEAVRQAAPTEVTTLVLGESGTGKELVANAIHQLSRRADGPFVAVNCSALPSELVESELFGHKKGSFSGASDDRLGRFQMADGGTLFLDELGDIPMPVQAKLLRALESRCVQPVGDGRDHPVDVRVVAATHVDLEAAVAEGRFRQDLLFRLSVFRIELPPLRDRLDDLPDLVEHLVPVLNQAHGRKILGVTAQALEILRHHLWPGNVRELRNVLEQAFVRATDEWITAGCLSLKLELGTGVHDPSYPDELDAARALWERTHIGAILEAERGDVATTAARLGIAKSNLYKRLKAYNLDPKAIRKGQE